ncbi:hypothetical protein D4Q52_18775 [Rhodopseudomonas palustris]|uniref:Uncharacterized protein n=1 Tax=Rhodopseudomonas palustris TaxID=1076 RepID=A0A418V209_RHOPL|nr:hypothetical protein D4Q52_18775 [Rhodopseudomonas palustris]
MPGLVPGIHACLRQLQHKGVDGRDKPGHDGGTHQWTVPALTPRPCARPPRPHRPGAGRRRPW